MECERCNESLSAYADRVLSRREQRDIENHLAGCRRCQEDLAEIRCLSSLLKSTPDPQPSSGFWTTVYASLDERARSRGSRLYLRDLSLGWGVATASLILLVLMAPPRQVNRAPIPPTTVQPSELVSLHSRLRSDVPLADSASLHYSITDAGEVDDIPPVSE